MYTFYIVYSLQAIIGVFIYPRV